MVYRFNCISYVGKIFILEKFTHKIENNIYLRKIHWKSQKTIKKTIPHWKPILWNAIIKGYERIGFYSESLSIYNQMQDEGIKLDTFTFVVALMAYDGLHDLKQAMDVQDSVDKRKLESYICGKFPCNDVFQMWEYRENM
jgi:pentatricopeptide repeat protein